MAFAAAVVALLIHLSLQSAAAQQSYVNNKQLNCTNTANTTLGFVCNAAAASCTSYLTFRSTPTYNNPATIAYLLAADAAQIAAANNISDVAPLPADTLLIVPVNCSCNRNSYQQHSAAYAVKTLGETYFTIANDTYQSLTTCQALIRQNPIDALQLVVGSKLTVPLRCACPTAAQTAAGFKYLLTYLVRSGDTYSSIAAEFSAGGSDIGSILEANMLSESDMIFFFTPILVPLRSKPEKINAAASPPTPPPPPAIAAASGGNASKKWIFIGVGIGGAILVISSSAALVWFLLHRRRHHSPESKLSLPPPSSNKSELLSQGIVSATEILTIYKLEEVEKATNFFAESNRINGSSVYLASFNGDEAVVKVMKIDVSREIDALRRINHSRIVRLSGFCLHEGTTYLVYEHVEKGSLAESLRGTKKTKSALSWKQRIEIAYDVADALNYLHNFTNPPYIHKNLTSNNILLDVDTRAKLANFGLARAIDLDDGGAITRHVVGAYGYMPREYVEAGLVTPKLDVFAFGVVMLELLSGREPVVFSGDDVVELLSDTIHEVLSGENVREKLRGFVDPSLGEEYPLELAYTMAQLAMCCVARDVDSRPLVSQILVALSMLRSSSLDWDPSQETSSFSFDQE